MSTPGGMSAANRPSCRPEWQEATIPSVAKSAKPRLADNLSVESDELSGRVESARAGRMCRGANRAGRSGRAAGRGTGSAGRRRPAARGTAPRPGSAPRARAPGRYRARRRRTSSSQPGSSADDRQVEGAQDRRGGLALQEELERGAHDGGGSSAPGSRAASSSASTETRCSVAKGPSRTRARQSQWPPSRPQRTSMVRSVMPVPLPARTPGGRCRPMPPGRCRSTPRGPDSAGTSTSSAAGRHGAGHGSASRSDGTGSPPARRPGPRLARWKGIGLAADDAPPPAFPVVTRIDDWRLARSRARARSTSRPIVASSRSPAAANGSTCSMKRISLL